MMCRPLLLAACLGATLVLTAGCGAVPAQRQQSQQVEWLYSGGDPGGMKYSALTDIHPDNLSQVELAWEWKHPRGDG